MSIRKLAKYIAHSMSVPITEYLNAENGIINVRNESGIFLFWYRNIGHIYRDKIH